MPADSTVLCSLNSGRFLLLNTGLLILEIKSLFKGGIKGAELIPFAHLSKVSVRKQGILYMVHVFKHQTHSGVVAGSSPATKLEAYTANSDNANKFQELLLGLIAASSGNTSPTEGPMEKIGKLKELLDLGAITPAEFEEKKKKFMDAL